MRKLAESIRQLKGRKKKKINERRSAVVRERQGECEPERANFQGCYFKDAEPPLGPRVLVALGVGSFMYDGTYRTRMPGKPELTLALYVFQLSHVQKPGDARSCPNFKLFSRLHSNPTWYVFI